MTQQLELWLKNADGAEVAFAVMFVFVGFLGLAVTVWAIVGSVFRKGH